MEAKDPRGLDGGWTRFQVHSVAEPSPDLAPFVARYWIVEWDLRGQPPYQQPIVPYPNVHLTFVDHEPPMVTGVARGRVFRTLAGQGRVVGVAFRPGAFRPFLGRPVSAITGRTVPAASVFGEPPGDIPTVSTVESYLRRTGVVPDSVVDGVAGMVDRIAADPELTRVEAVGRLLGTGTRQLQRLFKEYVGVGPKWVIRRYRLEGVSRALAEHRDVHWGRLAADLGYADQAHLTRDFTAMFGETPTQHAQRYPVR